MDRATETASVNDAWGTMRPWMAQTCVGLGLALLLTGCGGRPQVLVTETGMGLKLGVPEEASGEHRAWIPAWNEADAALDTLRRLALRGTPESAYACQRHARAMILAFPDAPHVMEAHRMLAWSILGSWQVDTANLNLVARNASALPDAIKSFNTVLVITKPDDPRQAEARGMLQALDAAMTDLDALDAVVNSGLAGWRWSLLAEGATALPAPSDIPGEVHVAWMAMKGRKLEFKAPSELTSVSEAQRPVSILTTALLEDWLAEQPPAIRSPNPESSSKAIDGLMMKPSSSSIIQAYGHFRFMRETWPTHVHTASGAFMAARCALYAINPPPSGNVGERAAWLNEYVNNLRLASYCLEFAARADATSGQWAKVGGDLLAILRKCYRKPVGFVHFLMADRLLKIDYVASEKTQFLVDALRHIDTVIAEHPDTAQATQAKALRVRLAATIEELGK